jgi:DNA-binding NtrC family response regulator
LKQNSPSLNFFTLLHLDDDPLELRALARHFQKEHSLVPFQVHSFLSLKEFKAALGKLHKVDFAILDICLSDQLSQNGISVVGELKKYHPNSIVFISSNLDDPDSVLQSLRAGADEFLSKRIKPQHLLEKILHVRTSVLLKRGDHQESTDQFSFVENKYCGESVSKISKRIPQIIRSAVTSVYIEGESGTGKEIVADLFSKYAKNTPFVKMNCGSISQSLLESELFGYVKGAFTGAVADKLGVIEAASGGWLFLDEVASLSASAQVALLRVLENQEVTRIGESFAKKVNLRFIAASNVPLMQAVEAGTFRNDLWQRLCETEIILKPLRERRNEIPHLISFFCRTMQGGPYQIDQTALNVLCQLPWSEGNVRELRNCLRAMTEHQIQGVLSPMSIPERILSKTNHIFFNKQSKVIEKTEIVLPIHDKQGKYLSYPELCHLLLKNYVEILFSKGFKISCIAKTLKIARSTLQIKLKTIIKQKKS